MSFWRTSALSIGFVLSSIAPVSADAVSDFYQGKTVTLYVGAGAGGSFDFYARPLVEHMPAHIPGKPTMIVKIMGGAGGGLPVANQAQNTAPKDGTYIAMTQPTIAINQLLYPASAKYDVRQWNWIGLMAPARNFLGVWHTAPAQTIEEAKRTEVIIGAMGRASPTFIVPQMMNEMLGTKFKIVLGYNGVADLNLAMERGEIQGRGAGWASVPLLTPQYITDKSLTILVVDGLTREPAIPDLPLMIDLAPNDRDREVMTFVSSAAEFGRSVFAPPGVPADRVAALRAAFDATMMDEAFLKTAESRKIPIEAHDGQSLGEVAAKVIASSPETVAAARRLMGIKEGSEPE